MEDNWPNLVNPPIAIALFQLKFSPQRIALNDFLRFDMQLKHIFPNRRENIHIGIDLGGSNIALGISKVTGKTDAKIASYIYFTNDQKFKLELSEGTLTLIDERPYAGWENFKQSTLNTITILSELLNNIEINRTSIRFINRFVFNEFETPQKYFNTLISSNDGHNLTYPIRQYGFRFIQEVPHTDIHSIVNHNVENTNPNNFLYTLDIDVLDHQNIVFEKDTLSIILEKLREVKNEIFFNSITAETINLCN